MLTEAKEESPRMTPAVFFKTIFGSASGFVCIAVKKKEFKEVFYKYPDQLKEMHEYVERSKYSGNVYFCPQLLAEPRRTKTNVVSATCAWADLDTCHPRVLLVRPTISLETSPNRYQAFWVFEDSQDPAIAEDVARRIAYKHADEGADRSGWDLTQLLRVPGTRNFKYGDGASAPEVMLLEHNEVQYRLSDFSAYPVAEGYEYVSIPLPTFTYEDGIKVLERYSFKVSGAAHSLFHQEAEEGGRSEALFRLEMSCAESGMTQEETFQVARDAKCNKWIDQPELLWRDVCRAFSVHARNAEAGKIVEGDGPQLVTDQERQDIENNPCFVERYIEWASSLGDAAVQYHQAGAFIALSALLAGSIVLPTSFGPIIPNLWLMILANTTLSRKSTSMNTVMGLIEEIDESLLMATDGSIEGFASALASRPDKVSIFFRDEFTGLLESMTKKDYMAGMPEFFTNLYDGRSQLRRLRKEEIKIKNPRLIIFAGGIKDRMQSLVTFEHVTSGFLPRFIFVTADTDPTKVRPLGPPTEENWGARDAIKAELRELYEAYRTQVPIVLDGKVTGMADRHIEAGMTRDAWTRFNRIDQTLMQVGMDSGDLKNVLTPLYARLGFSMLKAAVLVAASRTRDGTVTVEEEDIVRAAYYGQGWRRYAQDVVSNIGKGPLEHKIELVANAIHKRGRVARSALMQQYHLQAQEMTLIVRTLEERGLINTTVHGKQQIYQSMLSEAETTLKGIKVK
jgi:hypothetical protein